MLITKYQDNKGGVMGQFQSLFKVGDLIDPLNKYYADFTKVYGPGPFRVKEVSNTLELLRPIVGHSQKVTIAKELPDGAENILRFNFSGMYFCKVR
ncbi:MAG: hypothetical protein HY228_02395 [Candidatus Yonathbacteria bacterium]|nr:hypothetical protein [Candidatus Yonathbacteria bacterium]